MEENGWIIDSDMKNTKRYQKECGTETYHGDNGGDRMGTVYTSFREYGSASLSFGNCYNGTEDNGYVLASLNSHELGRVTKNTNMEVSFRYFKGDLLFIRKFGQAVVQINYFNIDSCGKFRSHITILA